MPSEYAGRTRRRLWPLALLLVGVIVAVAVLVQTPLLGHTTDDQSASLRATVVVLRTEVADLAAHATARETQIAQQQRRIEQLQGTAPAGQATAGQGNSHPGYLASFLTNRYSYVLFLTWDESSGFVRNGRLLATDNNGRIESKTFVFTGLANNGGYGFNGNGDGITMTFTGKANSDGTFTVSGLPWRLFPGFVGGTFGQTLHAATLSDYNDAVKNLSIAPAS